VVIPESLKQPGTSQERYLLTVIEAVMELTSEMREIRKALAAQAQPVSVASSLPPSPRSRR
jgi:hypothetical protein